MENDTIPCQPRISPITNRDILDQIADIEDICQNREEEQALASYKTLCDLKKLEAEVYLATQRMIEILPATSDEFKMYKRYRKYIVEYGAVRNTEFEKLESDENIKYPLEQAWRIFRERQREQERDRLENWRKNREIELEKAKKQCEEAQTKRSEISNNYKKIDNTLSAEQYLRCECKKKILEAENNAEKDSRSSIRFACIAGIVGIIILTFLFYLILPTDNCLPHLLVAIVLVFLIGGIFLTNDLRNITKQLCEMKEQYNSEKESEIIKMYHRLFQGSELYDFLGVPQDIALDSYKSLPKDKDFDTDQQFGKYTRYINPCGNKYHLEFGCSTAVIPAHLFTLVDKEPCSRCANGEKDKLPEWYVYLKKLKPVIEKYPFLFDLSIKPYG